MISHEPPPSDWPKLDIVIHRVSFFEVQKTCGKYMGIAAKIMSLGLAGACAEVNFSSNKCDIWLPRGETDPSTLEHEMDHCLGGDHIGESDLRDAWTAWKARK